jgi:hypothetical protein
VPIVETVERYADGLVGNAELSKVLSRASGARRTLFKITPRYVEELRSELAAMSGDGLAERRYQADILRDVYGPHKNGVSLLTLRPEWLSSDVVLLAHGIYAERAFDRMPILADAIQEAGCDNAEILDHCRGAGPHVRGCWVVDLVLGKE